MGLPLDALQTVTKEQLVEAGHRGLFSLLQGLGTEPVARLQFVCHILE